MSQNLFWIKFLTVFFEKRNAQNLFWIKFEVHAVLAKVLRIEVARSVRFGKPAVAIASMSYKSHAVLARVLRIVCKEGECRPAVATNRRFQACKEGLREIVQGFVARFGKPAVAIPFANAIVRTVRFGKPAVANASMSHKAGDVLATVQRIEVARAV